MKVDPPGRKKVEGFRRLCLKQSPSTSLQQKLSSNCLCRSSTLWTRVPPSELVQQHYRHTRVILLRHDPEWIAVAVTTLRQRPFAPWL